jgi:hypothetical protein
VEQVEHRLFSFITMNWRARPLISHQVVIETIAATTTKAGLKVRAMLDTNTYEKGIKISDKKMRTWEARHLHRHDFHGDWELHRDGRIRDPPGVITTPPGCQRLILRAPLA